MALVYSYVLTCRIEASHNKQFQYIYFFIEEKIDRPEATGSSKQSKFSPMVIASLGAMAIGGMALLSSAGPALQVRNIP